MKLLARMVFCLSLLAAVSACSSSTSQRPTTQQSYIESRNDCLQQADKKLGLFDRPDTYPISDEERKNARMALFSECMNGPNSQVAGTAPTTQAPQQIASKDLGALSPAAGGNKPPQIPPTGAVQNANTPANIYSTPGGTVIVLQSQNAQAANPNTKDVSGLAALSPSSGGNKPPQTDNLNASYPGATVVVVQGAAAATPQPAYRPALPVAIPVPAPASAAAAPANAPAAAAKTAAVRPASAPASAPMAVASAAPAKTNAARPAPPQTNDPATQELERILAQ